MLNDSKTAEYIADDDPEVARVMRGLHKGIYRLPEVISDGPHGRTTVYEHIKVGLLSTFVSNGRRLVYAVDYSKYLVALKRIGEAKGSRHHLSLHENRPARDSRSRRGAAGSVGEYR